jgi:hypothetical protein
MHGPASFLQAVASFRSVAHDNRQLANFIVDSQI